MAGPQRTRAALVALFAAQVLLASVPASGAGAGLAAREPVYTDEWWSEYHATAEVYDLIKAVAAANPDIVSLSSIGSTHESRQLLVAKVSDNVAADEEDEPDVLVIAGTHAREWTTYHAAAYLLNYLTGHYRRTPEGALLVSPPGVLDNDSFASWIVDNREVYILAMVNPDGIEYAHTTDNLWRKNREPNPGVVGLACTGTDINRNFDWHWGELQGDSHVACADDYAGPLRADGYAGIVGWRPGESLPGAFSTAEARALRDFELAHDFKTALSLHSYSGLVLYPWGHTGDPSPDDADFVAMADVMANQTGYTPQQGYDLYKTAGVWDDWTYGVAGAYAFTIEMGQEFQPPAEEILMQAQLVLAPELYLAEVADDLHLLAPVVEVLAERSREVDANAEARVTAKVDAFNGVDGGKVSLVYSTDDGATWAERPMAAGADGTTYTGDLPALRAGGQALYFVRATDNEGITRSGPKAAPYQAFEVHAKNGLLDQLGTLGLLAVLGGAGLAGALLYLRFGRARITAALPRLPRLPRLPALPGKGRRAAPTAAAPSAPPEGGDFESALASRPGLKRFLDESR